MSCSIPMGQSLHRSKFNVRQGLILDLSIICLRSSLGFAGELEMRMITHKLDNYKLDGLDMDGSALGHEV